MNNGLGQCQKRPAMKEAKSAEFHTCERDLPMRRNRMETRCFERAYCRWMSSQRRLLAEGGSLVC